MKVEVDSEEYNGLLNDNRYLRSRNTELQRDMTNLVERGRLEKVGGILSGKAIESAVARGDIEITPFTKEHINPASIDLTLGKLVRSFKRPHLLGYYDSQIEIETEILELDHDGIILRPGRMYLMHTVEVIHTKYFVPVLDGKSSIGRLGICIHLTAGYGDPGFNGQYTLEVTSVYPMQVYAGMRFAQMRFHTLAGERVDYQEKGSYVGESALGPVASMAWKQFR